MSKTDDKRFRVHLLKISNIMGIQEAEIKPGALTLIEGKNGVGKTSVVEALKAAFGKGHQAKLLREGETEGEVVVLLDDGRGAPYLKVTTTITKDQTKRAIGYPGDKAFVRPAEAIANLRNEFTLFPTEFLTMKKQDRLDLFLSAIPLRIGKEDLAGILPLLDKPGSIDLSQHALKVLGTLDTLLREQRANLNADCDAQRKTAKTMRDALPEENEEKVSESRVVTLKAQINDEVEAFNSEKTSLQRDRDQLIEEARRVYDAAVSSANLGYQRDLEKLTSSFNTVRVELQGDLTKIQMIFDQSKRNIEARAMIERLCTTAEEAEIKSERLTKAIHTELNELRSALLEKIPIKGVSIKDQDIIVESANGVGVPFDSVNTAERIRVVCDLALLNAGPLPIICLDGAEVLDEEHLIALRDALAKRKAQCVASRVTQDDELRVNRP